GVGASTSEGQSSCHVSNYMPQRRSIWVSDMLAYAGCAIFVNLTDKMTDSLAEYSLYVYELHRAVDSPLFSSALAKCGLARGRYMELKEAVREHEETHHCSGSSVSEHSLPR